MNEISPRPHEISRWLGQLSLAVSNPPAAGDLAKRSAAIAMACADVPPHAWSAAALAEAMRTFPFWPAAAELRDLLLHWCADHPAPRALPALGDAGRAGWSDEDRSWARYWQVRKSEDFAAPEGFTPPPYRDAAADPRSQMRAHVASLIRSRGPRAWRAIAREEGLDDCGGAARRVDAADSYRDRTNVARSVAGILALRCRDCGELVAPKGTGTRCRCGGTLEPHPRAAAFGRALAVLVWRVAPENLALLPPEWLTNLPPAIVAGQA